MPDCAWCRALVVVRFDETKGQQVVGQVGEALSSEALSDLQMLSMPENLASGKEHGVHTVKFCFRVRGHLCFATFRQYRDGSATRGYNSQSVILVSPGLTFIGLFYELLDRLADVLKDSDSTAAPSSQALEIAFQHFKSWPVPREGAQLSLPFLGSIIPYVCPSIPAAATAPAAAASGLFSDASLVQLGQRHGLLPTLLWTLWELVVTGSDVVVYSPSAEVCSAVVVALVSLAAPLPFAGDYRPYLSLSDSDTSALSSSDTGKAKGRIVGITNPFLLRSLSHFQCALFLSAAVDAPLAPPPPRVENSARMTPWALAGAVTGRLGSWVAAAASSVIASSSSSSSHASIPSTPLAAKLKVLPPERSLEAEFDRWVARGKSATQSLLCLRSQPRAVPDVAISRRLQSITDSVQDRNQACIVGDMLLKEHFRSLTVVLLRAAEQLQLNIEHRGPSEREVLSFLQTLGPPSLQSTTLGRQSAKMQQSNKKSEGKHVLPPSLCGPAAIELITHFATNSVHFEALRTV